jgi:urease accessory protein
VDWLYLAPADLSRRRLRATTVGGREVAIALPRDARLHDGAVLHLDASGALVVRVDAESWLRVRPTSAEAGLKLGYHAGNLHWRVAFCDGDLLVALEHRVEIYLDRLKDLIAAGSVRILDQETRS